MEDMDCTKQTGCDSLSYFYFLSLIPSDCEWLGIHRNQKCRVYADTNTVRICVNLQLYGQDSYS